MDLERVFAVLAIVVVVSFLAYLLISARNYSPAGPEYRQYGDLTLETLELFSGFDPFRPILLAVKGRVYNVTEGRQFYGRGGSYKQMAGKECARALAKMRLEEADFTDDLSDCTDTELKQLHDWILKLNEKYPVVGKIVPSKKMTLEELSQFDGSDSSKPMYLAISGVIFDVSSAPDFYGPDGDPLSPYPHHVCALGMYPFAGHECARAFALVSVDVNDCVANLDGLCKGDLDTLKEWEFKFRSKYNIIGHVVDS